MKSPRIQKPTKAQLLKAQHRRNEAAERLALATTRDDQTAEYLRQAQNDLSQMEEQQFLVDKEVETLYKKLQEAMERQGQLNREANSQRQLVVTLTKEREGTFREYNTARESDEDAEKALTAAETALTAAETAAETPPPKPNVARQRRTVSDLFDSDDEVSAPQTRMRQRPPNSSNGKHPARPVQAKVQQAEPTLQPATNHPEASNPTSVHTPSAQTIKGTLPQRPRPRLVAQSERGQLSKEHATPKALLQEMESCASEIHQRIKHMQNRLENDFIEYPLTDVVLITLQNEIENYMNQIVYLKNRPNPSTADLKTYQQRLDQLLTKFGNLQEPYYDAIADAEKGAPRRCMILAQKINELTNDNASFASDQRDKLRAIHMETHFTPPSLKPSALSTECPSAAGQPLPPPSRKPSASPAAS